MELSGQEPARSEPAVSSVPMAAVRIARRMFCFMNDADCVCCGELRSERGGWRSVENNAVRRLPLAGSLTNPRLLRQDFSPNELRKAPYRGSDLDPMMLSSLHFLIVLLRQRLEFRQTPACFTCPVKAGRVCRL